MTGSVAVVGTALGFEADLLAQDPQAEASNHVVEHMIGLIAQPTGSDLE
jgi:hypothetical protein